MTVNYKSELIEMYCVSFSGFFVPGFPKLLRFQEHHDKILKKLLSRLFKNLVSVESTSFSLSIVIKQLQYFSSRRLITFPYFSLLILKNVPLFFFVIADTIWESDSGLRVGEVDGK